jgi:hypothetical protein
MMFQIDEMVPDRVHGWLIPDNPAAPAEVVVVSGGGLRRERVPAAVFRADIRESGFHPTGHCGFTLDASTLPLMATDEDFDVLDVASNTLLYRRSRTADVAIRLFNLETQTLPVYPIARSLFPMLQMIYTGVETIAEEALVSVMRTPWLSVLVSGGLLLKNYEGSLAWGQGFSRTILLSHPARELAARLMRAKSLGAEFEGQRGWRGLGQDPLIEVLDGVDLGDPTSLGRALRKLDDEQFFALGNSTTRKLVAKTYDAPLEKHHVGLALDSLAAFDLVGFEDDLDAYVDGLESMLGRGGLPRDTVPGPPELSRVMEALAQCRPAGDLLELDGVVYSQARAAFDLATRAVLGTV